MALYLHISCTQLENLQKRQKYEPMCIVYSLPKTRFLDRILMNKRKYYLSNNSREMVHLRKFSILICRVIPLMYYIRVHM